jgi:hypothetical protein
MTTSLLLDQVAWDYVVDIDGNWAVCAEPYASAQDVACAIRCFVGDLWFDTAQGIPYLETILGKFPPLSFLKLTFETAAMSVPTVASAVCFITAYSNRALSGQVQLTLKSGQATGVGFSATSNPFILGTSVLGAGNAF